MLLLKDISTLCCHKVATNPLEIPKIQVDGYYRIIISCIIENIENQIEGCDQTKSSQ